MVQLHVFFSGNVQGVGFRYAARQMANQYRVIGWVKNLNDGRVEMLVEGDKLEVKEFLKALLQGMDRYISESEVNWSEATRQFTHFGIIH